MLNSGLASFLILHNRVMRFNRSRKGTNCIRQPCRRRRNVIAAYNLAQRMASLPQTLYTSYSNLGRQQWIVFTRPANTYGNSLPWMNAAYNRIWSVDRESNIQLPRTTQISGYSSLSSQGQQAIAAQGATVDLSDAVNASNLQTVGTIRANAAQRETDISQLEAPPIRPIPHSTLRWRHFSELTRLC